MLTVKFLKYAYDASGPISTETIVLHPARIVYVNLDVHHRWAVTLEKAPNESETFTVGAAPDCMFNVAYVMNADGRTVETVRD